MISSVTRAWPFNLEAQEKQRPRTQKRRTSLMRVLSEFRPRTPSGPGMCLSLMFFLPPISAAIYRASEMCELSEMGKEWDKRRSKTEQRPYIHHVVHRDHLV